MSSAAIASTLVALLPTYTVSQIPKHLQDTATALLAQSRSRAATLKPEEETARAWACSEIAIRRLQTRLNLPSIAQNPPCPPRVYKKLYQFLDRTLDSPAPNIISSPRSRTQQKSKSSSISLSKTPRSLAGKSEESPTPTKKRKPKNGNTTVEDGPTWLAPAIRHLCKKFSSPTAVPHVYVGALSVLRSQKEHSAAFPALPSRKSHASLVNDNAVIGQRIETTQESNDLATVVAILFLVLEKMELHASHEGLLTRPDTLNTKIRIAIQELVALSRANISQVGTILSSSKQLLEQWSSKGTEIGEWWDSVPQKASKISNSQANDSRRNSGSGSLDSADSDGRSSTTSEQVGRDKLSYSFNSGHGLGAVDWLSEERRREYKQWEAEMLQQIERMENPQRKRRT